MAWLQVFLNDASVVLITLFQQDEASSSFDTDDPKVKRDVTHSASSKFGVQFQKIRKKQSTM